MNIRAAVLVLLASVTLFCSQPGEESPVSEAGVPGVQELLVFIGTYTKGKSEGIYTYRMNMQSGALTPAAVTKTDNPSFLALHPSGRYLYAVGEIANFQGGENSGALSAFSVDKASGQLALLNQESSGGAGPCHVSIHPSGRHALVANYSAGSVASLPIAEDGRLGPITSLMQHEGSGADPARQKAPHAHSIFPDPQGRYAVAADLGADKLFIYRLDPESGRLEANQTPSAPLAPGAGPRHFAFHPSGNFLYAINELNSTVTAFRYDAEQGSLQEIQVIETLPPGFTEKNYTAEVLVHPSGRFLYGSNRGHDSIAIFAIDEATGQLTPAGHEPTQGQFPRNFGIDPTGSFLLAANQNSDSVVVFRIDGQSGDLQPTGQVLEVPTPVCVRFLDPAAGG